ncbi:MAG TPA: hypothetical protein VER98_10770 [Terriglobia bacterium]|nr:hypothetical protein [Terriglobia bacterium]
MTKKDTFSYAIPAVVIGLFLSAFSSALQAQTAPSTYSAYTGTDLKIIPPAPALGPANSVIIDPTFGSQILRVTDPNTNAGESFISTDAGFFRAWNADSTAIKLTGPHGDGYWQEFNPATFKVGDGSVRPAIHSLPFPWTWEWSAVDPDIIYFLNGNQIAKYNKSTGVTANLGGPPNGDPVTYMAVVVGQDNWVCAAVGAGVQDSYTKFFCVNPISPSVSTFVDVYRKTINGVLSTDPNWPASASGHTIGIHSISGGTGASWLAFTFHGQSWGANGDSVFDLATGTWSLVTNADNYWGGHISMGNGKYVNSAGSTDGRDSRGMVVRDPDNLMNSLKYQFIGQPPDTLNRWCDADHSSWANSMTNPDAPVLISRYTIVTPCRYTWTGEIDAAAVDGSNTVWRFAHNHNGGNLCYYAQSFAQISNDGHWALLSSYWDGTLGPDAWFGCSTRMDTFIVDLFSASAGSSSPGDTGPPANSGIPSTPIALVQSNQTEGSGLGSISIGFPSNNSAGNLIIACVRMSTSWQTVRVEDTAGNVYTDAVSQVQTIDGHQVHIFYAMNIWSGVNTVTATFSSTNNHPWIAVYEYSGLSTTAPLDQIAYGQGSSSTASSGATGPTGPTSDGNKLVFAAAGLPASYTGAAEAGTGYVITQQDLGTSRAANETAIVSSSGSITATFGLSWSTNWSAVLATFRQ